ncbi:MAG TPA: hypothetical protein VGQ87_02765 [Patescibacteria group bacterium]|jgi:hypothetical protein|nr:hypothetical protein [Patescibacteria group bacterium]
METIGLIAAAVAGIIAAYLVGYYIGYKIGRILERRKTKPALDELARYKATFKRSDWLPGWTPDVALTVSVDGGKSYYVAEESPDGHIVIKGNLVMLPYLGKGDRRAMN